MNLRPEDVLLLLLESAETHLDECDVDSISPANLCPGINMMLN